MSSLVLPARVLMDPLDATGTVVEARRWVWPLLICALCVSASGTAFAYRWDAGPEVVQRLQASGKLERMSETELTEEVQTASRKALVGGLAKGIFVTPLLGLVLAAALWVCAWLFDKRASFGQLMTVAAVALLPWALYHLIFTLCVLAQYTLTEARAAELVPSSLAALDGLSPKLKRVLGVVDFFKLWGVGLMGLGFSSATGMRRSRALLLCAALYLMYEGVFSVGLPGLSGGPGGGGGGR